MMENSFKQDNPLQMAKRIGKTRSLFVNDLYQLEKHQRIRSRSYNSNRRNSDSKALQNFHSMPILPHRRKSSDCQYIELPPKKESNLDSRVSSWLKKSNPDLLESDCEEEETTPVFTLQHCIESIGESEEDRCSHHSSTESVKSEFSASIINLAEKVGLPIEDVPWSKTGVDTLLKVKSKLFPIDKQMVSYVSLFFRDLFEKEKEEKKNDEAIVEMVDQEPNHVLRALKFIYSSKEEAITDENVAFLLLLSEEFEIARLRFHCDQYLQQSNTFNPLIAIQLAKRYKLEALIEMKCQEISKIKGFEKTKQFQNLDCEIQKKIMLHTLQRYEKAIKVLTQFDVYLCPHHGNNAKQSRCCFRAATYNTVEDRTFLVKMEDPADALIKQFEKIFKSDISCSSGSSSCCSEIDDPPH